MLTQGKMSKGGLNERPKSERPPTPPPHNVPYSYDEMVRKIVMWRTAFEQGYNTNDIFDSICVYLGEQQREIQRLNNLLKKK